MKTLNNPISNWNHRLPSLAGAVLATALILSGIAALAEPDLNATQPGLTAAAQTQVKATV